MPSPKLVLATTNRGKLREFQRLLQGSGFEIVAPADLGLAFEVAETGSTFEENACLKAVAAMELTGLPSIADDSGLEVDALEGRPGIFSARYAGGSRTSESIAEDEQCRIVLRELEGVPEERRTARFRCVIAIAMPDGSVRCTDGVFEGRIGYEMRGEHGFGYDPIFIVAGRRETSAELDPEEKNAISHRGQAARKALDVLKQLSHEQPA